VAFLAARTQERHLTPLTAADIELSDPLAELREVI
jgi:hypothetical protein